MNKKKIIVANWKMHPRTLSEARENFQKIKRKADTLTKVATVVCPPFIFLDLLSKKATSKCALGAQDVFWQVEGAYTGEISPAQLSAMNVSYVILGHSERRALGETDEIIQKKVKASLEYRLNVILCIGEHERDARGQYLSFLKDQIKKCLFKIPGKHLERLIIAYEPIWAIGAKAKSADTSESFFETAIFIRKVLSDMFGKTTAFNVPILYGGSVNEYNAEGFLKDGNAAGLLVGCASLDPEEFNEILKIAQRTK
ncbi:MAG: triose-phosphate isomerase [bacterium]|nr:triose-phosphate isomerase [bacterium]